MVNAGGAKSLAVAIGAEEASATPKGGGGIDNWSSGGGGVEGGISAYERDLDGESLVYGADKSGTDAARWSW